jgi:hypothetical protein
MTEDLGPLPELIALLAEQSAGVTITPVCKGQPMGGYGTRDYYQFDGWEIGYITPSSGGELAVGRTIAEAVTEALRIERGAG